MMKLHNYILPLFLSSLKSKVLNTHTYAYLLLTLKPQTINSMKLGIASLQKPNKVHLT